MDLMQILKKAISIHQQINWGKLFSQVEFYSGLFARRKDKKIKK